MTLKILFRSLSFLLVASASSLVVAQGIGVAPDTGGKSTPSTRLPSLPIMRWNPTNKLPTKWLSGRFFICGDAIVN